MGTTDLYPVKFRHGPYLVRSLFWKHTEQRDTKQGQNRDKTGAKSTRSPSLVSLFSLYDLSLFILLPEQRQNSDQTKYEHGMSRHYSTGNMHNSQK